ncbi:ABC transporter ATP-binding protein [Radicibacter daui]|uniref:ABC transporter ATP-binding protein n=1 Tax=Radicibacter daui TaxID=3064829 RepID=UPI004046AFB1
MTATAPGHLAGAGRPFVEIDRASLAYGGGGGVLALKDCSFSIEKGEFAAVVGPSGCGKSSLMKLISGLERVSDGTAIVAGQEVTGPLKIVGMAFQNPVMLPWRSTLRNVMLPLEIVEPHRSQFRARKAEYREKARALLATVGLDGFADRYPWQLSGGMQQRANLCRALIHEPELLMLDEPFGALDAFTREELWEAMQQLWMERRFTAMLVTHDLVESVFLADRVHVISNRPGRVIYSRSIDLPRPRRLEDRYKPEFVEIVHELRDQIVMARQQI